MFIYEYKIFIKDDTTLKKNYSFPPPDNFSRNCPGIGNKFYDIIITNNPNIYIQKITNRDSYNIFKKKYINIEKFKISTICNKKKIFNKKYRNIFEKNSIIRWKKIGISNSINNLTIFDNYKFIKRFFIQKNIESKKIWNKHVVFEKGTIDIMDKYGIFHRWIVASLKSKSKRRLIKTIKLIKPSNPNNNFMNCSLNELIEIYYL